MTQQAKSETVSAEQQHKALEWLVGDDCGTSSESLVCAALGVKRHKWCDGPPSDPSDLGRCLRMMKLLPWVRERAFPVLMKEPQWEPFLENWDKLAATMEKEVGIDWSKGQSAPITYELMKKLEIR